MALSKTQIGWQAIFDSKHITSIVAQQGFCDITADEIKQLSGREPRLMTKVDSREQLPDIFKNEGLSILAIANGIYRISKADPFIDMPNFLKHSSIQTCSFPSHIQTLSPYDVRSESAGLDIAFITGMLAHYLDETQFNLTLRNRLRGDLNLSLNGINFPIQGVQIEVDAGYESRSHFDMFEAKKGLPSSLSIRQLIYPMHYWQSKVTKTCRSHLFFYHENKYIFAEVIADGNQYKVDESSTKIFSVDLRKKSVLINAFANQNRINPQAPYPQADDLNKIIYILDALAKEGSWFNIDDLFVSDPVLADGLTTPRQYDYYTNALLWLNLINKEGRQIKLNSFGKELAKLQTHDQYVRLAEICLSDDIFHQTLLTPQNLPSSLFQSKYGLKSKSTQSRRWKTVQKWIKTFSEFVEFQV